MRYDYSGNNQPEHFFAIRYYFNQYLLSLHQGNCSKKNPKV